MNIFTKTNYEKGLESDENVNEPIKITKDDIMEMVEKSIKKILSKQN